MGQLIQILDRAHRVGQGVPFGRFEQARRAKEAAVVRRVERAEAGRHRPEHVQARAGERVADEIPEAQGVGPIRRHRRVRQDARDALVAADAGHFLGDVGRMGISLLADRGTMTVQPGIVKYTIPCNWKLAVDNLFDWYHVGISHGAAILAGVGGPNVKMSLTSELGRNHFVMLGDYGHAVGGPKYDDYLRQQGFEASNPWEHWANSGADKDGNLIVPLIYDEAIAFSEGLAAVKQNGKWGYLDSTGKVVVPLQFLDALSFHSGLAVVSNGTRYGFIDRSGKIVIPLNYENALSFSEDLAAVNKNGSWGYIDKLGKEVIGFKYGFGGSFQEGTAKVLKDHKWIVIDKTGKKIADAE